MPAALGVHHVQGGSQGRLGFRVPSKVKEGDTQFPVGEILGEVQAVGPGAPGVAAPDSQGRPEIAFRPGIILGSQPERAPFVVVPPAPVEDAPFQVGRAIAPVAGTPNRPHHHAHDGTAQHERYKKT